MGYLIDIVIGVISDLVTEELTARVEPVARWLIGKAVERLPADDRERFREEWFAHLEEVPSGFRKLWHAFGCYLCAAKVASVLVRQPKLSRRARVRFFDDDNQEIAMISLVLASCERILLMKMSSRRRYGTLSPTFLWTRIEKLCSRNYSRKQKRNSRDFWDLPVFHSPQVAKAASTPAGSPLIR